MLAPATTIKTWVKYKGLVVPTKDDANRRGGSGSDDEIGVSEAAQRLGLSPDEVRRQLRYGKMKGRKVAGVWLVDVSSLTQESDSKNGPNDNHPDPENDFWHLILSIRRRLSAISVITFLALVASVIGSFYTFKSWKESHAMISISSLSERPVGFVTDISCLRSTPSPPEDDLAQFRMVNAGFSITNNGGRDVSLVRINFLGSSENEDVSFSEVELDNKTGGDQKYLLPVVITEGEHIVDVLGNGSIKSYKSGFVFTPYPTIESNSKGKWSFEFSDGEKIYADDLLSYSKLGALDYQVPACKEFFGVHVISVDWGTAHP